MNIQAINNQNFQAKKFRRPVTVIEPKPENFFMTRTREVIYEYSNPQAKSLYHQAQREKSAQRKIELYEDMGEYKIIEPKENLWTKIKRKIVDLLI